MHPLVGKPWENHHASRLLRPTLAGSFENAESRQTHDVRDPPFRLFPTIRLLVTLGALSLWGNPRAAPRLLSAIQGVRAEHGVNAGEDSRTRLFDSGAWPQFVSVPERRRRAGCNHPSASLIVPSAEHPDVCPVCAGALPGRPIASKAATK